MYRIIFLTGPLKGRRIAIQHGSVTVGRDPDCGLQVPDDEVSRRHAVLEQQPDGVHVKDLGSMNAVTVNGVPVREALLRQDDVIEFGRTQVRYQDVVAPSPENARRLSLIQAITLVGVLGLVAFELVFLVGLSYWKKDVFVAAGRITGSIELPAASSDVFAEAEAELRRMSERQTDQITALTSAAQVPTNVTDEIQQLKADVADLRGKVRDMAEQAPPAPSPAPAPPAVASPPTNAAPPVAAPAEPGADPVVRRANEMMKRAAAFAARLDLARADVELGRIQIMAPDFIPAYVERARLSEQRGLLDKAGEQWTEVLSRTAGTPLYEQAAAERIRIARAQLIRKTVETPGSEPADTGAAGRLPRRLRIQGVTEEKLKPNEPFEEMRLVRVTLKPKPGERSIDTDEIRVAVVFFEDDKNTKQVHPSRAAVPRDALRLEGEWKDGDARSLSAAYIVPKGFREKERAEFNEQRRYLGYAVQVFYREELQDEEAKPGALLEEMKKLPPLTTPPPPPPPSAPMTNDQASMTKE